MTLGKIEAVAFRHPKAPVSEAYRILRTNLQYTTVERPVKNVLITSSVPGEGKSFTAANLAIVSAQAGRKVVLVDADLRKPTQHKIFGVSNLRGLTNYLVQGDDALGYLMATAEEGLFLLPSGPIPPNPADLLGSRRMEQLLLNLAEHYQAVIVDAPPVLPVTDAAVLSSKVEGVILVVRHGETKIELVRQAKERLELSRGRILGCVLNREKIKAQEYYYYSYYGDEGV